MKFRQTKLIPINDLKVGQYFIMQYATLTHNNIQLLFKPLRENKDHPSYENAKFVNTKKNNTHSYFKYTFDNVYIYEPVESDEMALDFL